MRFVGDVILLALRPYTGTDYRLHALCILHNEGNTHTHTHVNSWRFAVRVLYL